MNRYSYHNFMFPFQWNIKGYEDKTFSEQINLNNIDYALDSNWVRQIDAPNEYDADCLYNEKNYFYEFVHDALYDNGKENSLIRHFERLETRGGDVSYIIDCGERVYELNVNAINLNLYSTGVGVLSFYLYNEKYPEPVDVLNINQFGRRVFPPFINDVKQRRLIANSIEIKGLHGSEYGYKEDFNSYTNKGKSNLPARFIESIIHEVAQNISLKPVIDDRMYVQCWYKNDEWTQEYKDRYNKFLYSNNWYEFVFIDQLRGMSCQNLKMQKDIIKKATYERWQQWGSLYGVSRYSMMYLTNNSGPDYQYLLDYFENTYARMAELILVQKASVLRFSSEVTNLSNMDIRSGFSEKVSSLYKEYIRFVNQIHFREVSAQDQGIELYQKLYDVLNIEKHVDKLDEEIGELYNYVSLREDHKSSSTMSLLTWIATIAVPMTVIAGIFGMNNRDLGDKTGFFNDGYVQLAFVFCVTALLTICILIYKNRRVK